jgi:hypothetical protein
MTKGPRVSGKSSSINVIGKTTTHSIRISFGPDYHRARGHVESDGQDLNIDREGNVKRITVPRLEVHSVIVAELQTPES